jgi:hypothetical protein
MGCGLMVHLETARYKQLKKQNLQLVLFYIRLFHICNININTMMIFSLSSKWSSQHKPQSIYCSSTVLGGGGGSHNTDSKTFGGVGDYGSKCTTFHQYFCAICNFWSSPVPYFTSTYHTAIMSSDIISIPEFEKVTNLLIIQYYKMLTMYLSTEAITSRCWGT